MPGNELAFSMIKLITEVNALTIPLNAFEKILPKAVAILEKLSIGLLLSQSEVIAFHPSIMAPIEIANTSAINPNERATNSTALSTILNTAPNA